MCSICHIILRLLNLSIFQINYYYYYYLIIIINIIIIIVCASGNQVEEKYRVYKERLQKALALAQGKTPAEESIGEQRPPTDNYAQDEKPYKEIAEPEEDLAKDESVC